MREQLARDARELLALSAGQRLARPGYRSSDWRQRNWLGLRLGRPPSRFALGYRPALNVGFRARWWWSGMPRRSAARAVSPRSEQAGSRVHRDGTYGVAGHRRQRYRCFPVDGGRPRVFTELLPREESWRERCETCERGVERHVGSARGARIPVRRPRDRRCAGGGRGRCDLPAGRPGGAGARPPAARRSGHGRAA
jgi:hypothetical protein